MTTVYPVYLQKLKGKGYAVRIPDFDQYTEGNNLENAILMARDAIGQMGNYLEDEGRKIPEPFSKKGSQTDKETLALVDIDFVSYRRENDTRTVRKNCTIPYNIEQQAIKQNINFSKVLTEALKSILELNVAK